MKKLILAFLIFATSQVSYSQTRGVRIGYIDMEYILQNIPDYSEAKNQLELKAQRWKQEIEEKKYEIANMKLALRNEKVLLTKELIEEREEEITFLENELIAYQQKRFGPTGDLVTQQTVLVKPVQDQVFTAIQDIAEAKKYDFILDRSSDITLIYANKQHNLSDQIIRTINRAAKRDQMTKKQLAAEEEADRQLELENNPDYQERKRILEEKKSKRDSLIEARKLLNEQKRQEMLDRRNKSKDNIAKEEKSGTVSEKEDKGKETSTENNQPPVNDAATQRAAKAEQQQKTIEDRKREIQERRERILAEREASKKAREEQQNKPKED